MIFQPLNEHDKVLVRARVMTARLDSCQLLIPDVRGETIANVSYSELFQPPSTDDLYWAIRTLSAGLDKADDARRQHIARVLAELQEFGGHAMKSPE